MELLNLDFIQGFIRMCNDGWLQGWHERNGGNLTYRLKAQEVKACTPFLKAEPSSWMAMGVEASSLAGEYFLVTGSGKYMRNVILQPQDNICIVQINEAGDSYRIVWGLEQGGLPSSEFPSHFMNHAVRKKITCGQDRVIYHAHTPSLIALTYLLPLTARDFSRALWQSATECPAVFPAGVGVVAWMVPGSAEIALATSRQMERFDAVIWAHHGLFCAGADFDTAFGLMHTIEKAADIYVRVLSAGQGKIRQTISDDNLRAIADRFGVKLTEDFLD